MRGRSAPRAAPGTEIIEVDARDADSLIEAAQGADVILHALNPPYTAWPKFALGFAETAIAAARASGATLMFPGNVYNYGAAHAGDARRGDADASDSRAKARLRVEIEQRMRDATRDGVRVIVLRAGDFFGGAATGLMVRPGGRQGDRRAPPSPIRARST